jgi:hypothetical protein
VDFLQIHIAGHQKGAGAQQGDIGPLSQAPGQGGEVLQSLGVGHPGQGQVQLFAESLEVKFNDPAVIQGAGSQGLQPALLHGTVGLPADAQEAAGPPGGFQSQASSGQGVRQLGSGIAPKVTNAGSIRPDRRSQLRGRNPVSLKGGLLEGPVLAIEAVEIAGVIKDRQVGAAFLRAGLAGVLGISGAGTPRAEPVGHAVGRQRIIVETEAGSGWVSPSQAAVFNPPAPAKAIPPLGDPAGVEAESAFLAHRVPRRSQGQLKSPAALLVQRLDLRPNFREMFSDARDTVSQAGGNNPISVAAAAAGGSHILMEVL